VRKRQQFLCSSSLSAFLLCRYLTTPPSVELEQIMRKAYELPLTPDVVEAPHKELSEAPCVLDLAEDGLNRLLSLSASLLSFDGPKESFHPFLEREVFGDSSTGSGWLRIAVSRVSGRDQCVDAFTRRMGEIVLAEVACVGAQLFWGSLAVFLHLTQHWFQLPLVV